MTRWYGVFGVLLLASVVAGCSPAGPTDEQLACIQREFPTYTAMQKPANMCVSVCKACLGGSSNTCSTSCSLKARS